MTRPDIYFPILLGCFALLCLGAGLVVFEYPPLVMRLPIFAGLFTVAMCRRRRNAGYPAPPAQIPASGFPAPGSSVILTRAEEQAFTQAPDSYLANRHRGTRERQTFQQPVQLRPGQTSPLASSIQPLVQQLHHRLVEPP